MSTKKRAPKKVPVNYQNGKIYKVVNDVNDMVYIGSTTTPLSKRMSGHRLIKDTSRFHESMRTIGNDHFQIILIELFPCTCKAELEAREYSVMNEFAKDQLYNSLINGKPDDATRQKIRENQKWTDETRQKLRDNNAAKGKFGAASHVFKRGSISEYKTKAGQAGFQFAWQKDGKKTAKTFTYGLKRTRDMAHRACVDLQNQIYPLPNGDNLEELPFAEE